MSAVTVVSFDIGFILERWLRHTGRLARNTSFWQKLYAVLSILFAIAGAAGLILLTIFDTLRHSRLHNIFLAVFIGGYVISAVFICIQYQRLGIHYREHSILAYSFWTKLAFIIIEVALAIPFGVLQRQDKYNEAAVLEWVIAFIFFFYVLSFFMDFMPAIRTKHYQSSETEMDRAMMAESDLGDGAANGDRYYRGVAPSATTNGATDGYTNGYTNGNGMHPGFPNGSANAYKAPEPAPLPSRNF
ncbi:hypothetical protein BS50DRAFT_575645 [Corynespora cassiicola Philippines]|uniref:CWH43-like N-terminal domain-containing protein n=1 Tax=Corynespora cassiicola Philippines TaxID=1448308 RepID=A0A2T2NJY6_CORCC|nr:hypothetical protein BS50DRAFT_575645 [Corynespora cassiicola Philippines]